MSERHVVIIGGGYSGTLQAIHLLRLGARVTLIERADRMARGIAYSTPHGDHLLNVPAESEIVRFEGELLAKALKEDANGPTGYELYQLRDRRFVVYYWTGTFIVLIIVMLAWQALMRGTNMTRR